MTRLRQLTATDETPKYSNVAIQRAYAEIYLHRTRKFMSPSGDPESVGETMRTTRFNPGRLVSEGAIILIVTAVHYEFL